MSDEVETKPDVDIEALKQEKAALLGAVELAQKQLNEQRARWEAEQQKLLAQLDGFKRQTFDPRSALTADELSSVDEGFLDVVSKVSKAIAAKELESMKEELELRSAKDHERVRSDFLQATLNSPGSGLDNFSELANDPKFDKWLQSDEGAAANSALIELMRAPIRDIPKLTKRAAKYVQKFTSKDEEKPSTEDPASRVARHVSRTPFDRQEPIGADVMRKVKQLAASRNPADRAKARELLAGAA